MTTPTSQTPAPPPDGPVLRLAVDQAPRRRAGDAATAKEEAPKPSRRTLITVVSVAAGLLFLGMLQVGVAWWVAVLILATLAAIGVVIVVARAAIRKARNRKERATREAARKPGLAPAMPGLPGTGPGGRPNGRPGAPGAGPRPGGLNPAGKPMVPAGGKPTAGPGTGPSTKPGTAAPGRPGTGPSAKPGTAAPGRPGTGPSAKLGTATPGRPGTGPSTKPGTATAGRPGTSGGTGPVLTGEIVGEKPSMWSRLASGAKKTGRGVRKVAGASAIGAARVAGAGLRLGKRTAKASTRAAEHVRTGWSRRAPRFTRIFKSAPESASPSTSAPAAGTAHRSRRKSRKAVVGSPFEPSPTSVPVKSNTPPKQTRTFTVPSSTSPSAPSQGGTHMPHHATQGTVEAAAQMASYSPKNLLDIVNMAHSAPEAISSLALAFSNLASGLENTPAAASADLYRQLAGQLSGTAAAAGEVGAVLEANHSIDLNRIKNPRPGEQMADYGQNQSG